MQTRFICKQNTHGNKGKIFVSVRVCWLFQFNPLTFTQCKRPKLVPTHNGRPYCKFLLCITPDTPSARSSPIFPGLSYSPPSAMPFASLDGPPSQMPAMFNDPLLSRFALDDFDGILEGFGAADAADALPAISSAPAIVSPMVPAASSSSSLSCKNHGCKSKQLSSSCTYLRCKAHCQQQAKTVLGWQCTYPGHRLSAGQTLLPPATQSSSVGSTEPPLVVASTSLSTGTLALASQGSSGPFSLPAQPLCFSQMDPVWARQYQAQRLASQQDRSQQQRTKELEMRARQSVYFVVWTEVRKCMSTDSNILTHSGYSSQGNRAPTTHHLQGWGTWPSLIFEDAQDLLASYGLQDFSAFEVYAWHPRTWVSASAKYILSLSTSARFLLRVRGLPSYQGLDEELAKGPHSAPTTGPHIRLGVTAERLATRTSNKRQRTRDALDDLDVVNKRLKLDVVLEDLPLYSLRSPSPSLLALPSFEPSPSPPSPLPPLPSLPSPPLPPLPSPSLLSLSSLPSPSLSLCSIGQTRSTPIVLDDDDATASAPLAPLTCSSVDEILPLSSRRRGDWPGDRSVKVMADGIERVLSQELRQRYATVEARVAAVFGVEVKPRTWYDNHKVWRDASEDVKQAWRESVSPWKSFMKAVRK